MQVRVRVRENEGKSGGKVMRVEGERDKVGMIENNEFLMRYESLMFFVGGCSGGGGGWGRKEVRGLL